LRVYPNFAALTRYALFATDNRLSQMGSCSAAVGGGPRFRSAARIPRGRQPAQDRLEGKPAPAQADLARYQDERDQQIVFLIDCGRRMRAKDDDCSHFDHALDATLLLSYVSLRQGDAVGLMTMSGQHLWLAPRKSHAMVNQILNQVYRLQPGLLTSDSHQAAIELSKRLRSGRWWC
jgi:hypothetical protein